MSSVKEPLSYSNQEGTESARTGQSVSTGFEVLDFLFEAWLAIPHNSSFNVLGAFIYCCDGFYKFRCLLVGHFRVVG